MEDGEWTLFSPDDVPDLHDKFGARLRGGATRAYEDKAARGEIKLFKQVRAVELWRKMLSMLFETGHPWITFKDACNVRSPQQHVGVVHSLQPVHRDHAQHRPTTRSRSATSARSTCSTTSTDGRLDHDEAEARP